MASTETHPGAARPGRRWRRLLTIAVLVLAWLAVVFPRQLGIAGWPGVAQAIAFRVPLAIGLGVLALLAGLVHLVRRRWWCAALAIALVGAAVAQIGVQAERGLTMAADPMPPAAGQLVVLTYNTHSTYDAEALAQVVASRHADIVALPETTADTAQQTAQLLGQDGMRYQVLASADRAVPSALLIRSSLGSYRITENLDFSMGSFVARPVSASSAGPAAIAVVHPANLSGPRSMPTWREQTGQAVALCSQLPGAVVAGDFNSTVDHPDFNRLAGCVDGGSAAGAGGVGTWPTWLPWPLGTTIDHVLSDPHRWQPVRATVLRSPIDSDHRPLEVVLRRTPGSDS